MDFILTTETLDLNWVCMSAGIFNLYLSPGLITERETIIDTGENILIADANISFTKLLSGNSTETWLQKELNKLTNGYLLILDRINSVASIYTDVFGFYHLFYLTNNKRICISSDFKLLLRHSAKETDHYALLDLILFNYSLFDRTSIADIRRLTGSVKCTVTHDSIVVDSLGTSVFSTTEPARASEHTPEAYGKLLANNIANELSQQRRVWLTVTAGFDSRALLAACSSLNLDFSTFTYGQAGNIEFVIPLDFVTDYSKEHKYFQLDTDYIENIESVTDSFLESNLDNPIILDLPQYYDIMQKLQGTDIITGFMGGELLAGQSVGAQVTFTGFASRLLMARSIEDLRPAFIESLTMLNYINIDFVNDISDDYLKSLSAYFNNGDNTNVLKFMLQEKYSKYFGAVNKAGKNRVNLIMPFMSTEIIRFILGSRFNFLKYTPFRGNPKQRISSRIFYAKTINSLDSSLSRTLFDRLYSIRDLCHYYRFPIVALGYIQSHLFRRNKKNYPKPHNYDAWFGNLIVEQFSGLAPTSTTDLLRAGVELTLADYNSRSPLEKKRMANIAAAIKALKMINRI